MNEEKASSPSRTRSGKKVKKSDLEIRTDKILIKKGIDPEAYFFELVEKQRQKILDELIQENIDSMIDIT